MMIEHRRQYHGDIFATVLLSRIQFPERYMPIIYVSFSLRAVTTGEQAGIIYYRLEHYMQNGIAGREVRGSDSGEGDRI